MQVIALSGCGEVGNSNVCPYPCVARLLKCAEYGAVFEDDWYSMLAVIIIAEIPFFMVTVLVTSGLPGPV